MTSGNNTVTFTQNGKQHTVVGLQRSARLRPCVGGGHDRRCEVRPRAGSGGGLIRSDPGPTQPRAVPDDESRRQHHRGACDQRIEESAGRERDRNDVVGERPCQVAADRPQGAAGQVDCRRHDLQVVAYDDQVCGVDRDVGARSDGETEVCDRKRRDRRSRRLRPSPPIDPRSGDGGSTRPFRREAHLRPPRLPRSTTRPPERSPRCRRSEGCSGARAPSGRRTAARGGGSNRVRKAECPDDVLVAAHEHRRLAVGLPLRATLPTGSRARHCLRQRPALPDPPRSRDHRRSVAPRARVLPRNSRHREGLRTLPVRPP